MHDGHAREWPSTLDVDALRADGWRPMPFREFVLKIHSRCNLACDYCYMYEMADQSWRTQPLRMSADVIERTALRIAEHARSHRLASVDVVLHGGEPLLAGPALIERAVTSVRGAVGAGVRVGVHVQTNGTALDVRFLELFDALDVRVGVSLDGDRVAHDRHRRHAGGAGSHQAVVAALGTLSKEFRRIYSGLLCTIDLRNDPIATYEALLALEPPRIDFLLPHGNWNSPPPDRVPGSPETPYGEWLAEIFDRWYARPRREVQVRLFEEIIHVLLGGVSNSEMIGLAPVGVVVVETDGAIEQSDMLKSAYPGAGRTGLHVSRDSFDDVLTRPPIAARQIGALALAGECRLCDVREACGGGLYAHRYRRGSGFANPSVYCADLYRLVTHVRDRLRHDLLTRSPPAG
ncbi:FxsB family cyclophane-forming radical SAM/SPASM peptide maturase [Microtetraspora sp. NBRC 13810]|uniref:FxsB family cyclophane-forming radical SAM/SPASM peptide maturase n=1 Tax=Microtetraspora sp. NBRC 13810 TaxID=3030990 RepID=UPI0025544A32|nr:FxsB family cyclophane-forming radical SAM/SPASM peptide maturase [Microtetraspora sp. NBRC 13810]